MERICENFYTKNIKKLMPSEYSQNEHSLASKIFKSISYNVWSDKIMTAEQKIEYLDEYNKSNLKQMLIEAIETIKTYNIKKPLLSRDLTSVPTEWLFYNQKIQLKDGDNDIIKTFKTIKIFSTGKLKMGFQNGIIKENGEVILDSFDKAIFEDDKCYVMLSFIETNNLSTKENEEHVFLDYFLGNISFE